MVWGTYPIFGYLDPQGKAASWQKFEPRSPGTLSLLSPAARTPRRQGRLHAWLRRRLQRVKAPKAKDHIKIRMLHSGFKAQDKEDSRNHDLWILMRMWSLRP